MLVNLKDIFEDNKGSSQAIAAFNIANIDMIRAVMDAAIAEKKPVVIQIFRRLLDDSTGEYLAEIIKYMAKDINIPIVLHLDHGINMIQIKKAIEYGFTSVMVDGSDLDFEGNIVLVKEAKKLIALYGCEGKISLEAELGSIPCAANLDYSKNLVFTDPVKAEEFVKLTNINALAIAFGTAHGIYTKKPELNFKLIKEIAKRIKIPLVMHGGTGLSDKDIKKSIESGIKKVNVATELQKFYINEIKEAGIKNNGKFVPLDVLTKPIRENLMKLIRSKIKTISS